MKIKIFFRHNINGLQNLFSSALQYVVPPVGLRRNYSNGEYSCEAKPAILLGLRSRIIKKSIALSAVGIFLCFGSGFAFAKENFSTSLRAQAYGESARVKNARPAPNEEELLSYATPNWDTTLKAKGSVKSDSLPAILKTKMPPQERGQLAATIKNSFKGDIYLVGDEMLAGRRFWYSQDTGTLYFTRSAIVQIGAVNIAGLLNNIQAAIDRGYASSIETIAIPRQIKPLRVAKRKIAEPVAEVPEETAASVPEAESEVDSGQPAELHEPAASPTDKTPAAKRAVQELKSDLQALNRQAQKGATLRNGCRITQDTETRDEFTVWFDAADLKPGFTVMQFKTSYKGARQMPVIPHPHTFAANSPVRKTKRYKATLSRDEVTELLEKENRTAVKLEKRLRQNETEIVITNTVENQRKWAAETIGLTQTMLEPCAGRVESAKQQHPGEAGAILGYFSESYKNYLFFCHTLYNAKRKIEHSLQHNKAPAELVSEEFDKVVAAAAPWPRLQAILRVTKAGLSQVDLENWKFISQYFGWNMSEAARTNSLSFMPQDISREILAEIYYDACRFTFLKQLELLRQKLQAADSAEALIDVIVETHRLATLTYSIEWDSVFSRQVKEKASAYTSTETIETSPAYFIGLMLLDAKNQPVEVISGAGSVTPLEDLAVYQDYASIAQWYRPGCKIVLFVPTLTRFANFEQFAAYVEDWHLLQKMLPGSPEIWIGTVSEEGKVATYRPVAPNDQDLWDEVMTLVMQGMPGNQDLAAYLEKEVYSPPSAEDEAEAAQKRKIARSIAKTALSTEAVHPIYRVARNLPLFIQQGLSRSYTPELARDIMQFINLYFKKRFTQLREAKGVSIPVLHRSICITTFRCQRFAMEYVTRAFVLDQEWFQEVAIEGLTDPIGTQVENDAAADVSAEPAVDKEALRAKAEFAARDIMRDIGRHPDLFPPATLPAVEPFVRQWVAQHVDARPRPTYCTFKIAWDQAEEQKKQRDLAVHGQNIRDAQDALQEISDSTELATRDDGASVQAATAKAEAALAKLDPAKDAALKGQLEAASARLSGKFAELQRLTHLSPVQQTAQDLLTNKKFDRIRSEADPDTQQALELLRAIFEESPYKGKEKPGRLAKKLEHAAKGRGGVILEFYQKAAALAENYPAMLERQLLSSILRPRAAIDRIANDDLGYEIQPLSEELMQRLSDPQMTIGDRIFAIIEERGFKNPNVVRRESGLPSGTFSHITHSNSVPHPRNLYAIAKVLQVDPILIVEGRPWKEVSSALPDKQKLSLGRLRHGWSQEELAVRLESAGLKFDTASLDAKRNTVTQWEKGIVPSPDTRPFIRLVLGDNSLFTQDVSQQPSPRLKRPTRATKPKLPTAPESSPTPTVAAPKPTIDLAKIQELNRQAEALIRNRKFTDAEQLLLQALELDPNNGYTLGNLAKVCLELKNFPQSVEYAGRALAIDPNDHFARRMRALSRINLKQYDEAREDLLQILDKNPNDVQARSALDGIEYLKRGAVAAGGEETRPAVSAATQPRHIPGRMHRQEEIAHKISASSVLRPRASAEKTAGVAQVSKINLGNHSQILITAPSAEGTTVEEQTRNLLRDIERAILFSGVDRGRVVKQTIYVYDVSEVETIKRILSEFYGGVIPATDFIQQGPLNGDRLSIQLLAIGGKDVEVKRCNEYMTLVRTGNMKWAHLGGVVPNANLTDTYEQARDCFLKMKALLESEGFKYENVLRTWLYQRDIYGKDPDGQERYNKLNRARGGVYRPGQGGEPIRFGNGFVLIGPDGNVITTSSIFPPASTGIGTETDSFVMGCVALMPAEGVKLQFLENPRQISAFAYQPEKNGMVGETAPLFCRGIAVVFSEHKIIYVSGTASIIGPTTVHIGNVKRQTVETINNIERVFNQAGASLKNAAQLTVYIKNPTDFETVKKEVERRCPGVPCVYVKADVCRENLLVEIEAAGFVLGGSGGGLGLPQLETGAAILTSVLRPRAAAEKPQEIDMQEVGRFMDMEKPAPYALRDILKRLLEQPEINTEPLLAFLSSCESFAQKHSMAPLESRYPILAAVDFLEKDEQDRLVKFLNAQEQTNHLLRSDSLVVDLILLMLEANVPDAWLTECAPLMEGRVVYDIASEIWDPIGGLGRVRQFNDIPMHCDFLIKYGAKMRTIEPWYSFRFGENHALVQNNEGCLASLPTPITDIEEIDQFEVTVCGKYDKQEKRVTAVCYKGKVVVDGEEMEAYLIQDKEGYYTKLAYNYETDNNECPWEEFSVFFAKASDELKARLDEKDRKEKPKAWKPSIVHVHDSQAGLAAIYHKMGLLAALGKSITVDNMIEPVIVGPEHLLYSRASALYVFSTHTIPNRQEYEWGWFVGETLPVLGIPRELADLGKHLNRHGEVGDIASMIIRVSEGRIQGVANEQVKYVSKFDQWWLALKQMGFLLQAVTNGDLRQLTARKFRAIMTTIYPGVDVEHPTWEQVYETKRKAKREKVIQGITFDPDRPLMVFSGRGVSEKAGLQRALTDENIISVLELGFDFCFCMNIQSEGESVAIGLKIADLRERIKAMKADGKPIKGNLLFIDHFNQDEQQDLLSAADILVLDSDPNTEAAGLTEVDGKACGCIVITTPYNAGILDAPRDIIGLEEIRLGMGSTLRPDIAVSTDDIPMLRKDYVNPVTRQKGYDPEANHIVAEAFNALYRKLFSRLAPDQNTITFLQNLARYQATAIRASRVFESRLTAAVQLRLYNSYLAARQRQEESRLIAQPAEVGSTIERHAVAASI